MKLVDRVAVITGAGSGIGRALALDLAKRGNRVAISDVNEEGLEQTRTEVAALGADVRAQRLDVSDRDAVYAWADAVERDFGAAHLVVNNAGVALSATLREVGYEDFEWLMAVNFWGVVYGTRAFLPLLFSFWYASTISRAIEQAATPTLARCACGCACAGVLVC